MEYNIQKLREHLFKQEKAQFIQDAITILDTMGKNLNSLSIRELEIYNENVKDIGILLNIGDYLTVSDILKYELIPLFEKRGFNDDNLQS